ncbi:hypothetical protein HU675_0016180 [Bradyrhizobium septentrionale]|uniref:hypothetical protein n=1 Tax=Bradyrhizobium septentrionale TaxID=1404411 RepID=UPI0015967BCF|nr:hypothetical protein [Bradyrhizobium septentrionale]UGY28167.1 hypothetical protein HU675_0016180 [Bradyrhizobium septentrionale]
MGTRLRAVAALEWASVLSAFSLGLPMHRFRSYELLLGALLMLAAVVVAMSLNAVVPPDATNWSWGLFKDASGFFALCAVLVAGAQAAFFVRQLHYMRESLDHTALAATASAKAAEAAALSARAGIAIQLPIVRIVPDNLGWGDVVEAGKHRAYCSVMAITFSNLGPTRAFPVEVRYGIKIGTPLPAEPVYTFTEAFIPNLIFEPDRKITPRKRLNGDVDIDSSQWPLICQGQIDVWFYCALAYDDFMQTRHETAFCWRWQNVGMGMAWREFEVPTYTRKT